MGMGEKWTEMLFMKMVSAAPRGYGKNKADARTTTRKRKLLDLLPRRHVGRRRPQDRVELRLRRRQIIQVGVPKRF